MESYLVKLKPGEAKRLNLKKGIDYITNEKGEDWKMTKPKDKIRVYNPQTGKLE